jgi:predicted DNA-binding protein YlxM (UPF0122 family)
MNNYDTVASFSPTELNILLNIYEERLQKKMQNNELKRYCNADLTLEDTADLIEQKRKRKKDLETVLYIIKERFGKGIKKFKRDTSDDDEK